MHAVDVDLFSPGAQEHWYEAYDILHNEDPVHRLEGEGFLPGTDAYVLTKHDDIRLLCVTRFVSHCPVACLCVSLLKRKLTRLSSPM